MKRLLLGLMVLALGCATTEPTYKTEPGGAGKKFGSVQLPASYDPSVSGYPGQVGDILGVAGGATAWVKFSTGVTDWRAFPGEAGGGLSTVLTDSSLTGDGSEDTPLALSAANKATLAMVEATALARARSLVPAASFDSAFCVDFEADLPWWKSTVAGGGTIAQSLTDRGGVITISSTAGGSAQMQPKGAPPWIDNAQTSPWYIYYRMAFTTAAQAASIGSAGMATLAPGNPELRIGVEGALSTTNFAAILTSGAGATLASSITGPAIDTAFHDAECWNTTANAICAFDGTTIMTTAASNLPTTVWGPIAVVAAAAATRTLKVDKICFVSNKP